MKSGEAYLLRSDWLLTGLMKLLDGLLIVSQILLTSDKDSWETAAEVQNFRDPLFESVSACPLINDMLYLAVV